MQQICTGQLHPSYLEQKAVPLASLLVMASLFINLILLLLIAKKKGSISEVVPIHCPNVIPIGNILLSWTTTFFMTLEGVAYIYINRHKIKFLAYLEQFHPYIIIFSVYHQMNQKTVTWLYIITSALDHAYFSQQHAWFVSQRIDNSEKWHLI